MQDGFAGARRRWRRCAQFLVLACAAAGCGTTPPVTYYLLSAVAQPAAGGSVLAEKSIGVGPVAVPEYLDRAQILTSASANRLEIADGHRWAEPLADNIARVLRENLSLLLGTERVQSRSPSARGDYQLSVQVLRLVREGDGSVSLAARWSVAAKDGAVILAPRRSAFSVRPSGAGVEALVAAQSEALADLSREIAAALAKR